MILLQINAYATMDTEMKKTTLSANNAIILGKNNFYYNLKLSMFWNLS